VIALAKAIRAGSAVGVPTPRSVSATAGLSTFVGDAVTVDLVVAREASRDGGASGARLGELLGWVRSVEARATWVAVLAAWTSRRR
jgi:hypothetical protein